MNNDSWINDVMQHWLKLYVAILLFTILFFWNNKSNNLILVETLFFLGIFIWRIIYVERKRRKKLRKTETQSEFFQEKTKVITLEDIKEDLILNHVQARISEKLHTTFPDATWKWLEDPKTYIVKGGWTRIATKQTADYDFAEIHLTGTGELSIQMLNVTPLTPSA